MSDIRSSSRRTYRDHERPSRQRSVSPRRESRGRNQERADRSRGHGGFKWKDTRRRDPDARDDGRPRLERGYRNRSRSPRSGRGRAPFPEPKSHGSADHKSEPGGKKARRDEGDHPPQRPAAATSAVEESGEPMIIVHVNDRLGTRAAIPCLASDPIRLFKAQVAARIGRQPHEILLKRQGERPFKDQLTLEDYGVSNGVQIDLEIDTGE
ncbi:hypothetical protein K3495_g9236 [Podosphaera aphanis]|nr:hypothetical protein K3495_g9236 [Podosphaera aphanis]